MPAPRLTPADLRALMAERILVLDGALGTAVHALDLTAADYGGAAYEGCPEHLVLTRPDAIRQIHRGYLEAGADILSTDTFGGTPLVLAEYQLADRALEINRAAARLAAEEARAFSAPKKPRFVAGSMGPTTKTLSLTGGIAFDEMAGTYAVQARGLIEGGVDLLLLETCLDTLNLKAAYLGVLRAQEETGAALPLLISVTLENTGAMLAGQDPEALWTSVAHMRPASVGLNCATGPDRMVDPIRTLAGLVPCGVSCYPNAGLPDEQGRFHETPEGLAAKLARFMESGWLNLVGGCCGTTPAHIRLIAQAAAAHRPRVPTVSRATRVSGIEALTIDEGTRPILVGERTNVLGSRAFKRLIAAGEFESAAEVGRRQVRGGAHALDVCLQDPDRPEREDMERLLHHLTRKVKAPLMLDSTDAAVIETALKLCQGKCIINSVNLEDGEERFRRVTPLARTYGAALVVGCIDDDPQQAQAITRQRKLDIALRSHKLLTGTYGIPEEDLFFDALVFPAGTGDKNYVGSAPETIEGIRLIKQALPRCKTVLGISNVSFGLPEAGREVLNAVFLHHGVEAGLDMAIVSTEKLRRFATLTEEERRVADDLLFNRGADPVAAFAAFFRARKPAPPASVAAALPLEERLARQVVEGTKEGLIPNLEEARQKYPDPLAVINGPLMAGMTEVGRLFNGNQMIVAEVLQSAEVMKAAVSHLEQFMEKSAAQTRGTWILATVKGDVHDIGKNLVDIILSNNGYRVVNLGIKVPPETLIRAVAEHRPDVIGLSGLLVKSAQQMVVTVADFKAAGIRTPVVVGGAALTRKFTDTQIAPQSEGVVLYAKDAMDGLALAERIGDPEKRAELERTRAARIAAAREAAGAAAPALCRPSALPAPARSSVSAVADVPAPPDLKRHVLRDADLDEIFRHINPQMLLGKHLGVRGAVSRMLEQGDAKALEVQKAVRDLQDEAIAKRWMRADAVYQFFRAGADGDDVALLAPDGTSERGRWRFGRQPAGERLCLADYLRPLSSGTPDYVALFVTTCGADVRARAEELKAKGEYLKHYALQALALEGAEALAEVLHAKIRTMWGIGDPPGTTVEDLFRTKYRGRRFSFGYPACPRLEDQDLLFKLLRPEEVGVSLTEGWMMEPEATVSAVVFHHPEAKYFGIGEEGTAALEAGTTTGGNRQDAKDAKESVKER